MDLPCSILIVDDDWITLELLTDILSREGHDVLTTPDGFEAIRICREQQIEVIVLDYMMPNISGDAVVRAIREFDPDVQIILQTALDSLPPRKLLRELDIQGYHNKSDSLNKLMLWIDAAIKNYEQIRSRRDLEHSLLALGLALEARDLETAGHTYRVVKMAERMGQQAGLNRRRISALRQGAYLHDLGKLCIPDEILLKPGKLDPTQWALMKTHAQRGYELAARIPNIKPEALDVIRFHHEHWNGAGYPLGLRGEEIPILARLFAICDVFDALVSPRAYKPPWAELDAIREIRQQEEQHFDPTLAHLFITMWSEGAFDDLYELGSTKLEQGWLLEDSPVLVLNQRELQLHTGNLSP